MMPGFGLIFQGLFLAGALWLLIKMGGRFPEDMTRLRKKYRDYRTGGDPEMFEGMKTEERRRNYRETCVIEFRSEVITLGLLWALTVFAGLYVILAGIAVVRLILPAIKALLR